MIDLELPTGQAQLARVIESLAVTARSTGRDTAGGLLEALRDALAQQERAPRCAQSH
ncbi:hypothetical protein [Roseomonas populi]|uniref:Uncharacterized protein n=1 Tax=Roseomonas populi TaxID=3121582 RepID=A0ABT1X075_9PROT|nr:hypothetical protein [Roseomonas pecuniae]MCR0981501.1 hypothetical protein [Roseomonas pecuniae]